MREKELEFIFLCAFSLPGRLVLVDLLDWPDWKML